MRMGRFEIDRSLLRKMADGTSPSIFADMVPLHMEANFATDVATVWAAHQAFDDLAEGQICPFYVCTITNDESGGATVKWERRVETQPTVGEAFYG